jgi:hypothetical protein
MRFCRRKLQLSKYIGHWELTVSRRGDYIRHHKNEGMFIMECKGGAIHVYTPFATQTSGWARRIVQACSTPTVSPVPS